MSTKNFSLNSLPTKIMTSATLYKQDDSCNSVLGTETSNMPWSRFLPKNTGEKSVESVKIF